jgi:hypothetical protein
VQIEVVHEHLSTNVIVHLLSFLNDQNLLPHYRLVCRSWKKAVDYLYMHDLKVSKLLDIATRKDDRRHQFEDLSESINISKKDIAISAGLASTPATLAVSALCSAAGALTLNPVLFFGGLIAPACSAASSFYEPLQMVPALPVAVPVYCLTHMLNMVPLPEGGEQEKKQIDEAMEELQDYTDMTCSIIKESTLVVEEKREEEVFIASVDDVEVFGGVTYFTLHITRTSTVSSSEYDLLKRYTDFNELHTLLCRQYSQIMQPVDYFPVKRYWNSDTVTDERIAAFDRYMKFVLSDITLRTDPDVLKFIST